MTPIESLKKEAKKQFLFEYKRGGFLNTEFMEVLSPMGYKVQIPEPSPTGTCLNQVMFKFLEIALSCSKDIKSYRSLVEVMDTYLTGVKVDMHESIYDTDGNITNDSKHAMEFIVSSILNPILCL